MRALRRELHLVDMQVAGKLDAPRNQSKHGENRHPISQAAVAEQDVLAIPGHSLREYVSFETS
jgi:hypothetical protein